MIGELVLGAVSSLLASGVQGGLSLLGREKFESEFLDFIDEVEKELCSEIDIVKKNENFLNRQENIELILQSLFNDSDLRFEELNYLNFNYTTLNDIDKEAFIRIFNSKLKSHDSIRNVRQYVIIENIFEMLKGDSDYGSEQIVKNIIEYLNIIDIEINKNLNLSLWTNSYIIKPDMLISSDFEQFLYKLNKVLDKWNISGFDAISKAQSDNPFHSIVLMLESLSVEMTDNLGSIYNIRIRHIWTIIQNYEFKDNEYFIAVGALGLVDDYSDRSLYKLIIQEIILFLKCLHVTIGVIFKEKEHQKKIGETVSELHKHNISQMSILDEDFDLLEDIFINKKITDALLADKFNISIQDLRKRLLRYTSSLLIYSYYDMYSTELMIRHDYLKPFELYCEIRLQKGV